MEEEAIHSGEILFNWCSGWTQTAPGDPVLVDVYFPGYGPASNEQQELVREASGQIVHLFNLPVVRAEVPVSGIPQIVVQGQPGEGANHVRTVPEPHFRVLDALVLFDREVTDADVAFIEGQGGVVKRRYSTMPMVATYVPDEVIPPLSERKGVRLISLNTLACGRF